MLTIALVSPNPGCGKTTTLVNLAVGLRRRGWRVLVAASEKNELLRQWIAPESYETSSIMQITPSVVTMHLVLLGEDSNLVTDAFQDDFDYLLIDAGDSVDGFCCEIEKAGMVISCVQVGEEDDSILLLDEKLAAVRGITPAIELVVPGKADPGEWEKTSLHLTELAERFGEEQVADMIPFCEAIHDLPKLRICVWDLPREYNNRKQVFNSLVDKVLHMTR